MAAPTYVAEYPTAFNSNTTPKTALNVVAVTTGEVLIGAGVNEGSVYNIAITENGGASWVEKQVYDTDDYCETHLWSYTVAGNENLTVTFTTDGSQYFGGNVIRFSGTDGVGASNKAQAATGQPSVTLTTTQANSAIVVICTDYNAVAGTQTFTSNGGAGSPTNLTDYPGDAARYGCAIGYYANAGDVGAKTIGMSAPEGQKWTIEVIEVLGTVGEEPSLAISVAMHHYRQQHSR